MLSFAVSARNGSAVFFFSAERRPNKFGLFAFCGGRALPLYYRFAGLLICAVAGIHIAAHASMHRTSMEVLDAPPDTLVVNLR